MNTYIIPPPPTSSFFFSFSSVGRLVLVLRRRLSLYRGAADRYSDTDRVGFGNSRRISMGWRWLGHQSFSGGGKENHTKNTRSTYIHTSALIVWLLLPQGRMWRRLVRGVSGDVAGRGRILNGILLLRRLQNEGGTGMKIFRSKFAGKINNSESRWWWSSSVCRRSTASQTGTDRGGYFYSNI